MSQIPSITGNQTGGPKNSNDALRGLDMTEFLDLMITELQNQDPLNPMENSEILQQISQIREVGATESLTQTLDSVLLGQNVASATNLIGKYVRALDDAGKEVLGQVDRVTISDGAPKVHIGDKEVRLKNVGEIRDTSFVVVEANDEVLLLMGSVLMADGFLSGSRWCRREAVGMLSC